MKKILAIVSLAAAIAAAVVPAWADGSRRAWRGSGYAVGAISRNVITPYYYGYYGSHYSYVAPDSHPRPHVCALYLRAGLLVRGLWLSLLGVLIDGA